MIKFGLLLVALPLVLSNAAMNVAYWSSATSLLTAQILAGVWALGLSAAEYVLPVYARHNWRTKPAMASVAALGAAGAIALSITVFVLLVERHAAPATIQLAQRNAEIELQAQNTQTRQQAAQLQIDAAAQSLAAAQRYTELDRLTAGALPALQQLQQLTDSATNNATAEPLKQPNSQALSNPLEGMQTLAALLGVGSTNVRLAIELTLAILIEFVAVFGFMALCDRGTPVIQPRLKDHRHTGPLETKRMRSKSSTEKPGAKSQKDETLEEIRKKIVAGEYGDKPALRNILPEYPGIRWPDMQRLRVDMIEKNQLVDPNGNGRVTLMQAVI